MRNWIETTHESIDAPEAHTGWGLLSQYGELVTLRKDIESRRPSRTVGRPKDGRQDDEKRDRRERPGYRIDPASGR